MPRFSQVCRPTLTIAALAVLAGCATGTAAKAGSNSAGSLQTARSANPTTQRVTVVRADSAWDHDSYVLAAELYQSAVIADPSNSHAVFRLATLRAWDGQFEEGIGLYRRYVALEPQDTEGRLALARTIAWSGKYPSAIAIYDSVIARDKTYRDAVLGRAQTLAWAGQLTDALSTYQHWVSEHPNDREASLEYARALSWNGQLDEAEQIYTPLARTGDANAQKGLARVIAWRGDLQRSEHEWRQVLDIRPNDAEALTGLAQTLRWEGRQSDAESALHLALRANPTYGDARALLRWVQADLRPTATVTGLSTNDSDNNRANNLLVDYSRPSAWNTTIGGRYTERRADFAAIESQVHSVNLFARWQPGSWQLRADGGASRHSSNFGPSAAKSSTLGNGALHASGIIGRALTVGLGASRAPFDETALLIANGVLSAEYAGEAELLLPGRLTLMGGGSHARITGGARDNARNAFSSALRWNYNRRWSLAVGGRQFGYDTTSVDGYFSPRRYTLAEGSARGRLGSELGWNADADFGLGRQTVELYGVSATSRVAERASASIGYRIDPSQEVNFFGSYANVAAPGQTSGSDYKAYSFGLRVRLGL